MDFARIAAWCLILSAAATATGCTTRNLRYPSPVDSGFNPSEIVDPNSVADTEKDRREFAALAERLQWTDRSMPVASQQNVLVLSGGGAFGAYSAGVLVGWSQTGTRPKFDVVTGISTGALIAPLAFAGPEYDDQLKEVYTTLKSWDIFRIASVRALFGEGIADSTPLARKIDEMVTPQLLRQIATEHDRGRRLYVGTTDLESGRAVHWDLGEIAKRGEVKLFRKLLLASASIPGFFPPVKIPVTIDGKTYTERHIDGGVTNALFFRRPFNSYDLAQGSVKSSLLGCNLYILVSGKLFADPESVRPGPFSVAGHSVSTLLYSQTRSDLQKMYSLCLLEGMNYYVSAIPANFPTQTESTDFDPVKMKAMFDEGYRQAGGGTVWRLTPPGIEPGESAMLRTQANLQRIDRGVRQLHPPTAASLPSIPR